MNKYEPFDLGIFDAELTGQMLSILRNPTRGFRQRFLSSIGDEFTANVAEVLNCKADEIEPLFADYDAALFTWLFIPIKGDDDKWILPYIYELWDGYSEKKVKLLRLPSPPRVGSLAALLTSQSATT